jgi:hypothetical protein
MEVLLGTENNDGIPKAIASALIISYLLYAAVYVAQLFHPIKANVNIGIQYD